MVKESVMVLGDKETFIIRVLVKKIKDAGMDAAFVPATVNDINEQWNNYSIITYYFETGEIVPGEIVSYLNDKLTDTDRQIYDTRVMLATIRCATKTNYQLSIINCQLSIINCHEVL